MNLDERLRHVQDLDLEPIKFKLVHDEDGPRWSITDTDRVEVEYKRFLALNLKNVTDKRVQSIVPTREVDKFWHAHILDTMKYEADCAHCLGFFLHHFPYLGLRGPEDALALQERFRESLEYYHAEFGQSGGVKETASDCDGSDCAPEPSCSGEPPPKITTRDRPVLVRA
ncbi:MAG TPA: hypothetical protein VJZ94_00030 [Candidatus Paceibacterota bacterium]|nr:hypothetical protein [Candidatus Paceibacterota bacterium]